ncbi:MAG TPA: aldehyde ferredoxin oxidoreductase, partial [bacterium]|nr:aldehyde ferredoxin oxidoreductase [bacterium]
GHDFGVESVTGWNTSLFELMKAGERGTMMARAFNSREGFTSKDDRLPDRLFDPKPDGPDAGKKIIKEEFEQAIELLYKLSGCDPSTGRPGREKLIELGLEWVEELLEELD